MEHTEGKSAMCWFVCKQKNQNEPHLLAFETQRYSLLHTRTHYVLVLNREFVCVARIESDDTKPKTNIAKRLNETCMHAYIWNLHFFLLQCKRRKETNIHYHCALRMQPFTAFNTQRILHIHIACLLFNPFLGSFSSPL